MKGVLRRFTFDQLVLDELAGLSPEDHRLGELSERLVNLVIESEVSEEIVGMLQAHYRAIEQ